MFLGPQTPLAYTPFAQTNGNLSGQSSPPSCWIENCVLIPYGDPRETGADPTTVYYWVSSLLNGKITRLQKPYEVALQELQLTGSFSKICYPAACYNSLPDDRRQGLLKDLTVVMTGSGGTVRQFFYVDSTPVKIFWPNVVNTNLYYGSDTQVLTLGSSTRSFQQDSPDTSHGACNTAFSGC
jgi:hypothetical protein